MCQPKCNCLPTSWLAGRTVANVAYSTAVTNFRAEFPMAQDTEVSDFATEAASSSVKAFYNGEPAWEAKHGHD